MIPAKGTRVPRVLALEANGIMAIIWIGVPSLVGEQVDGSHSQEAPSALRPGDVDRVSYTPVCQPASITHVHTILPGEVKLSCGGKSGTKFSTLIFCLVKAKLLYRHRVEDSAWKQGG